MRKRLILNADDYGWDADANAGILDLIKSEKIHNASILANFCSYVDLKAIQSHQTSISCGLHVCLNEGKPLLELSSSSIQNEFGEFYASSDLFFKALMGEIKYKDVFNEIKAQYVHLNDAGIEISHADSHQHIHQYPFLSPMITHALQEIGIKKIRSCKPFTIYDIRRFIILAFANLTKRNIHLFKHPDILITDFTNKNFSFESSAQKIISKLNSSKYETIEWMCHPAKKDRMGSYLQRKNEYDFLMQCDWNDLLSGTTIELSQYKSI